MCTPVVGDVTRDDVGTAIAKVLSEIKPLDILINNAGIPGQTVKIDMATSEEISVLFQTHCLGALRCVKAALPFMLDGKLIIVNVTSRFGSVTRWASGAFADRSISYS
jgi:NADP-dependent 3-hydroxy acid dehydrogenase YdfG